MAKTSILNLPPPKASKLLAWYDKSGRDLPWRSHLGRAPSPYHTWVSEIMLQQTGVSTVIPYYERFVSTWPTVSDLAKASEDDVLAAWAGLGYYRRARMLHTCAKKVTTDYKGLFPEDLNELKSLPGIGDYTANAIRTIAFDKPGNVVDGNVERVVARVFAFEKPINQPKNKKELKELAASLVPSKRHGDYAQALMDLGATICTPQNPKCGVCPWQKNCLAYAKNKQAVIPIIERKKAVPHRYAAAFIVFDKKGRVLLQQRPTEGLLGGLWECPSTEWRDGKAWSQNELRRLAVYKKLSPTALNTDVVHIFSHFKLTTALFGTFDDKVATTSFPQARWFALPDLPALSTLTRKILKSAIKTLGDGDEFE